MNYCPSVYFIGLCQLTEAQTCEGVHDPKKGLIKRTRGQNYLLQTFCFGIIVYCYNINQPIIEVFEKETTTTTKKNHYHCILIQQN